MIEEIRVVLFALTPYIQIVLVAAVLILWGWVTLNKIREARWQEWVSQRKLPKQEMPPRWKDDN